MKIIVLSDTHIPAYADRLDDKIYDQLRSCDMIIHAGDIASMSFMRELESFAETKAVAGNMDDADLQQYLPKKMLFEAANKKIGVVHGKGAPLKVLQTVSAEFKDKPDIIIFGHSHIVCDKKIDNTIFFNPGSAVSNVFSAFVSFGVIEINGDDINTEIIRVDD